MRAITYDRFGSATRPADVHREAAGLLYVRGKEAQA